MYHKWESAWFYANMMHNRNDMREKSIGPKIYGDVKSKPSEDKQQSMTCNLYTDSVQQSRHIFSIWIVF